MLDVPLKPRNLNPDEIRAEHVKLSWDPPADDGGTPITGYLVRYMDIDSGEWATACTVGDYFFYKYYYLVRNDQCLFMRERCGKKMMSYLSFNGCLAFSAI